MTKFYQNSAELIIAYYTYFVNRQRINILLKSQTVESDTLMYSQLGDIHNTKQTALMTVLSIYNKFYVCYNKSIKSEITGW